LAKVFAKQILVKLEFKKAMQQHDMAKIQFWRTHLEKRWKDPL